MYCPLPVAALHIAAGDTFTMRDLHGPTAAALDTTTAQYRLASLRYDLSKLRAKGLVERVPHSRRYRLLPHGYSICLLFLKLFERVYAPLTAGLLRPVTADTRLAEEKRARLVQSVAEPVVLHVLPVRRWHLDVGIPRLLLVRLTRCLKRRGDAS